MSFPVIDTARTGARIADLRKTEGLSVHAHQVVEDLVALISWQSIRQWQPYGSSGSR